MDKFLLKPNCSVCGVNLNKDKSQELFLSLGESVDLTCPSCGVVWRFWLEIATNQKKIGQKEINMAAKSGYEN